MHAGKLSNKAAEDLAKSAKERKISFIGAVIASGAVSAFDLAHTLSVSLALPLVDLSAVDLERLPKGIVEPKLAVQYQLVMLGRRGNRLFIGGADPTDQEAVERIKFATQLSPEWVIVEYDKLARLMESQGTSANESLEALTAEDFEFDVTDDAGAHEAAEVVAEVEDAPVVRFLQKMLIDAINLRASDLHFEPYEYHYRVRFRVDGELREITQPPIAIKEKLASRIKVISRLDIAEKRVPQDGRMKMKFGNKAIDFRVSTLPTLFGEKIVIRILDPSSAKLGIEALGYEKIEKDRLMTAIVRPYGMILVTGPTGSGKTVSLYTCLNILNQPGVNILAPWHRPTADRRGWWRCNPCRWGNAGSRPSSSLDQLLAKALPRANTELGALTTSALGAGPRAMGRLIRGLASICMPLASCSSTRFCRLTESRNSTMRELRAVHRSCVMQRPTWPWQFSLPAHWVASIGSSTETMMSATEILAASRPNE